MFIVLFFSFCFSYVISIENNEFSLENFYSKYSKNEWMRASSGQKTSIIEDFIKRESAIIDATKKGFDLDPFVLKKIKNVTSQLLVNMYYDKFVAFPEIDKIDFALSIKNLKKEVNVKHIVVSHNKSNLPNPNPRTKNDAVILINNVRKMLVENPQRFDSIAVSVSEDPSVHKNAGGLGWLDWGRTPMSFQSVVWDLDVGELSPPIETTYGYHLAIVDSSRKSEYDLYNKSSYEYEAMRRTFILMKDKLKDISLNFEKKLFDGQKIIIYEKAFSKIFSKMIEYKSSLSSGERFVFIDFLQSIESRFLLVSINNKDYGLKYFLADINQQNPSSIPSFSSTDKIIDFFKQIVLRKYVKEEALKKEIDKEVFFKNFQNIERGKIIYDYYLRHLVNSVNNPDSVDVKKYYEEHKNLKYFKPEKVVVRQIRLKDAFLADSLIKTINQDNFSEIASSYSINRRKKGGLMEPFERGKYNDMGSVAFNLKKGEISGVIKNPDKTFSIILLESKIKKEPLPIKLVYKRIESLLLKRGQDEIKEKTFEGYLKNPNLKIGKKYENYIN